jgi:hypothetical protein
MIGPEPEAAPAETCAVLSIDAWADGEGGWSWNNWVSIDTVPLNVCDLPHAKLLAMARRKGWLPKRLHVYIEDDGYNLVLTLRRSSKPLVAIEYGPHS